MRIFYTSSDSEESSCTLSELEEFIVISKALVSSSEDESKNVPPPPPIENFCCDVCGKMFTRKDNLLIHLRQHIGVTKYSCNFESCQKRFIRLSDLKRHQKTHVKTNTEKCIQVTKKRRGKPKLNHFKAIQKTPRKGQYDKFEASFMLGV